MAHVNMISFGPFLTHKREPHEIEPGLLYSGYVLEFTSKDVNADVPIFRYLRGNDETAHLKDYVVQATDVFIVLEKTYEKIHEPSLGSYIPLETFLKGLYEELKPFRPLKEFMEEFKSHLPLSEPW